METIPECAICGLLKSTVGGVFRLCAGHWACGRCWDSLACTVLTQADATDESAEREFARDVLRKARRLARE